MSTESRRTFQASFEGACRAGRLALKELREILRDRRTIVTLFLMPLLLYPLLSIAMQQFFLAEVQTAAPGPPTYNIGFETQDDAEFFAAFLQLGDLGRSPESGEEPTGPMLRMFHSEELEASVGALELDLGIRVVSELPEVIDPNSDLEVQWEAYYLPASSASRDAFAHVKEKLQRSNVAFLQVRLRALEITQPATPVTVAAVEVDAPDAVVAGVSLITVIPLILILMTITGAVYPAIDLTAGERERGTLEILVAAPVSRLSLLLAKYVAVVTVAMLTATVNLGTMTLTILVSGLGPFLFGEDGLTLTTVVQVLFLLVLFAAFFSSILLAMTSFARSFKEAQAYLIPLMLASMGPGMMSIIPGLELGGLLTVAPLINIVLLARDLFQGEADSVHATVVIVSTLLYALAGIGAAARIFGSEDVLYGDHGGWATLWRQPSESRPVPTVSGAMSCLALIFPGYFLLNGAIAMLDGQSLAMRLAAAAAVTMLLFIGIPIVASRLGRIEMRPGFRLIGAPWISYVAAIALGASLWPFAHEIVVWKIELGLAGTALSMEERLAGLLTEFRALPIAAVILFIAVIPAVSEEFFFRGYLFSALHSRSGPRASIFGTALVFGLFHLVATDRLSVERFLPSMMMGVALGWVCWRTASVLPGMLLHATHNGLLISAAYYQQRLSEWGIGVEERSHLPVSWIAAAATAAAIAVAILDRFGRPAEPRD